MTTSDQASAATSLLGSVAKVSVSPLTWTGHVYSIKMTPMTQPLSSVELANRLRTSLRDLHSSSRVIHEWQVEVTAADEGPDRVVHIRLAPDAAQVLLDELDWAHDQSR